MRTCRWRLGIIVAAASFVLCGAQAFGEDELPTQTTEGTPPASEPVNSPESASGLLSRVKLFEQLDALKLSPGQLSSTADALKRLADAREADRAKQEADFQAILPQALRVYDALKTGADPDRQDREAVDKAIRQIADDENKSAGVLRATVSDIKKILTSEQIGQIRRDVGVAGRAPDSQQAPDGGYGGGQRGGFGVFPGGGRRHGGILGGGYSQGSSNPASATDDVAIQQFIQLPSVMDFLRARSDASLPSVH